MVYRMRSEICERVFPGPRRTSVREPPGREGEQGKIPLDVALHKKEKPQQENKRKCKEA